MHTGIYQRGHDTARGGGGGGEGGGGGGNHLNQHSFLFVGPPRLPTTISRGQGGGGGGGERERGSWLLAKRLIIVSLRPTSLPTADQR